MSWFSRQTTDTTNDHSAHSSGVSVSLKELIGLNQAAKGIDLLSRKRVYTDRAGGHISGFRGRGIDFEEARVYQAGDDIRLMDWRVTARSGEPHTKIFHEERERPVFILVDQGPSMCFGTRVAFKSVIAAKTAALLAWAGVLNGDRVGSIVFAGNQHQELRPRSRKAGVLPLLKVLAEMQPSETGTDQPQALEKALARLRHVSRPGSLIFIISDFYHISDAAAKHLGLLARHSEILVNYIYDAIEQTPPPPNRYSVSNGQQVVTLDTRSKTLCQRYQQHYAARYQRLLQILKQHRIPLLSLATHDDVVACLQQGLWQWQHPSETGQQHG